MLLPRRAYYRLIDRRTEQIWKEDSGRPIDLSRIGMIREAELDSLRDAAWLENELLPKLGLNDEMLHEPHRPILPEPLHGAAGQGLLSWQLPNQFGSYLTQLSRYPIKSYLEIGVRHGGTFVITVEYLSRFGELERAVGVDISDSPSTREYERLNPRARFVQVNTRSRRFRRLVKKHAPWDLVLIDGDHHEEAVRRDFEAVIDSARIVVFHDIASENVPGVQKVWHEIQSEHTGRFEFVEFAEQYDDVVRDTGQTWLGLGVAIRKRFRAGQGLLLAPDWLAEYGPTASLWASAL